MAAVAAESVAKVAARGTWGVAAVPVPKAAGLETSTVAVVATAVEWVAADRRRSADSVEAAEHIVVLEKRC